MATATASEEFKREFKKEFNASLEEGIIDALTRDEKTGEKVGFALNPKEHKAFLESVEQLARHAGLERAPNIVIANRLPGGPVWTRSLPNAGATLRTVMVSKSMLDLTGSSAHKAMTPALETVMAHEFSHLKDGFAHMLGSRLQAFALPLVAITGWELYDRAVKKAALSKNASSAEKTKHIAEKLNEAAEDEHKRLQTREKELDAGYPPRQIELEPAWQRNLVNLGKTAAVGALGLAGGLAMARRSSLAAEFRADRMAVELTGNPEIFKQVLKDLETAHKAARKYKPVADTTHKQFTENFHKLMSDTVHAHPDLPERLSYIDRVTQERAYAHVTNALIKS